MFEKALTEYALLVRGNSAFSNIIFHTVTGIVIGLLLYIVVNLGGDAGGIPLFGISLPYNRYHMFLMDVRAWFGWSEIPIQGKALEFLTFMVLSIIATATAYGYMRKSALKDALSPIRRKLLGTWDLFLDDFADTGDARRSFTCKVEFGETEARKLMAKFFESSELELNGSTALIALYVPETEKKPDTIQLSFPIDGKILVGPGAASMLYWLQLTYLTFRPNQQIEFEGQWYRITLMNPEYRGAGAAKLLPARSPPKEG